VRAKETPVGAPRAARGAYALADPYLAFWLRVLYSDLTHIEGGKGAAVLRRARPRWETHLGRVFEDAARWHARQRVARGEWPPGLVVGRWWAISGESAEIDVLGLEGGTHGARGRSPVAELHGDICDRRVTRLEQAREGVVEVALAARRCRRKGGADRRDSTAHAEDGGQSRRIAGGGLRWHPRHCPRRPLAVLPRHPGALSGGNRSGAKVSEGLRD
jgi:hypothetical protein